MPSPPNATGSGRQFKVTIRGAAGGVARRHNVILQVASSRESRFMIFAFCWRAPSMYGADRACAGRPTGQPTVATRTSTPRRSRENDLLKRKGRAVGGVAGGRRRAVRSVGYHWTLYTARVATAPREICWRGLRRHVPSAATRPADVGRGRGHTREHVVRALLRGERIDGT